MTPDQPQHDEMQAFIEHLHGEGATIVECINAVSRRFGLNLGQAKQAVTSHVSWAIVVKANEPLHDEAISMVQLVDGGANPSNP